MATDLPAELAERVIGLYPTPMSKIFFGNSGSDANDTQVKLVWYYNNVLGRPEKKKIISRHRGYHGVTVMSAGLTGLAVAARRLRPAAADDPAHDGAAPAAGRRGRARATRTFAQRLADELERLIVAEGPEHGRRLHRRAAAGRRRRDRAARDLLGADPGGAARVRRAADLRRGDHRASAGSGSWFGAEVFGDRARPRHRREGHHLRPTCRFPAASSRRRSGACSSRAARGSARSATATPTRAHPLAAAAALANLDVLENDGLVAQAAARGTHLHRRLHEAFDDHPLVGEVRGRGLIAAVEFVRRARSADALRPGAEGRRARQPPLPRARADLARAARSSDTIAFSPPFVVTEAELDEMVAIARRAVDDVASELR